MIVSEHRGPMSLRIAARGALAAFAVAALFSAGCTSFDLVDKLPFGNSDDKPKIPTKIVAVWSEEVLHNPGEKSVRGFAGRLMFYAGEDTKPVKVDGTFSVFAFDDVDRNSGYSAPERKFIYRPEELPKYYSKSELGHSYSVWLPWDEVGGPERKLCLIARFEHKKGGAIVAKPCTKTLNGRVAKAGDPPPSAVRLTSHVSPAVPDAPESSAVRTASHVSTSDSAQTAAAQTTITIDVPPSFAQGRPRADASSQTVPATSAPAKADGLPGVRQSSAAGVRAARNAPAAASATTSPEASAATSAQAARLEPPASHATRYARQRFPARREPTVPPAYDPARRAPLPATSLSRLPPTPRSEFRSETRGSGATEEPYPQ